jgi:hypothetical protein
LEDLVVDMNEDGIKTDINAVEWEMAGFSWLR